MKKILSGHRITHVRGFRGFFPSRK